MQLNKVTYNSFLGALFLIFMSLYIGKSLVGLWLRLIGLPLFGTVESSIFFDVISIAIVLTFILWIFTQSHYAPKKLCAIFGLYILFYLEFRCIGDGDNTLVPFKLTILHYAKYADIVPFLMLFYLITARKKNDKLDAIDCKSLSSLYFEDDVMVDDLLGYRKQAQILATLIRTEYSNTKNAVGIAVTGEWGYGKSTFLCYMENELSDCISVKFDPWTENSNSIANDLLDRIETEISKKDYNLGRIFRSYAKEVNVTNITGWFPLFILAVRNAFYHEIETDRRNELTCALRKQKNPIVVFIDDSDRLPSNQFLETISIIRGLVNLPNLVFIVAIDQTRASQKLSDYGGADFMSKLFNVIHPLQPISENIIVNELVKNISAILAYNCDDISSLQTIVYDVFSTISIKNYVPTLREMKRFCNVVEKDFSLFKNAEKYHFLDVRQWLIIELLKYTDISTYSMLAVSPEFFLKKESRFGMISPYYKLKEDALFNIKNSQKLLSKLFPTLNYLNTDSVLICNPCYFRLYFDSNLPKNYITTIIIENYKIYAHDSHNACAAKAEALKIFIHEYWPIHINTNLESAVSEILKTYPIDLLYPVLEKIIYEYKANRKGSNFKELSELDIYRKYARIVKSHQYLSVLSFIRMEDLCDFNDHEAADDSCILKSENPLMLCAIFNNQIRNWEYNGRLCSDRFLFELLKRLVSEKDYHNVIWIVADCVSADLQEKFLKEYLKNHLLDSLPYMLRWKIDRKTGQRLIYSDIPAFEGLFLSYSELKATLTSFKWNKTYEDELIDELLKLVGLCSFIDTHEEYFKSANFPTLESYIIESQKVINEDSLKSDTFWKGGDRIEKVCEYRLA